MSNLDGLTSGISQTLVITDINGLKTFATIESFSATENADVQSHTDINGITRHPKLHMEWTGSFVFQRTSPALDIYFADQERIYYQGGDQVNVSINETIKETDGSFTKWQYTDCVLTLTDGGRFSGTEIVKQSVSFKGRRKIKIS